MDIEKEIQEIAKAKTGNKEIAIFYDGESDWHFLLGNKCEMVRLGESDGEIESEGTSIEDVIYNMKIKMGLATL